MSLRKVEIAADHLPPVSPQLLPLDEAAETKRAVTAGPSSRWMCGMPCSRQLALKFRRALTRRARNLDHAAIHRPLRQLIVTKVSGQSLPYTNPLGTNHGPCGGGCDD